MTQRVALFLAVAMTVCVLVIGAGIALTLPDAKVADAASASTDIAPATLAQTAEPTQDLTQLIQQRDAQYRAEIKQANAQLQQAYQTIQALKAQNQELRQRELVYQQQLDEAARYIQFIQNQILQGNFPDTEAPER